MQIRNYIILTHYLKAKDAVFITLDEKTASCTYQVNIFWHFRYFGVYILNCGLTYGYGVFHQPLDNGIGQKGDDNSFFVDLP